MPNITSPNASNYVSLNGDDKSIEKPEFAMQPNAKSNELDFSKLIKINLPVETSNKIADVFNIPREKFRNDEGFVYITSNKNSFFANMPDTPLTVEGSVATLGLAIPANNGRPSFAVIFSENLRERAEITGFNWKTSFNYTAQHELIGAKIFEKFPNIGMKEGELMQQVLSNRVADDPRFAGKMDLLCAAQSVRPLGVNKIVENYSLIGEVMQAALKQTFKEFGIESKSENLLKDWAIAFEKHKVSGSSVNDCFSKATKSIGVPDNKLEQFELALVREFQKQGSEKMKSWTI